MKTYDEIITYKSDSEDPKKGSLMFLYEHLTIAETKTIIEFFKAQ